MKNLALVLLTSCLIFSLTSCNHSDNNPAHIYQPITPGSYWKYKVQSGNSPSESLTETVTPDTANFQGKIYHKTTGRLNSTDSLRIFYYAKSGSKYYVRSSLAAKSAYDLNVEILYLDESKPAGSKWIFLNDSSKMFKTIGTCAILAKGISKTINGKLFKDIIHSRATLSIGMKMGKELGISPDLDLNLSNLVQTFIIDFYVAKGIGIVESDMSSAAAPQTVVKQTILGYDIK